MSDHLFPIADAFLDLHSGGSSLDILPARSSSRPRRRPAQAQHRGGPGFRCSDDGRHLQPRRAADRHGAGRQFRPGHRRHGDGRRRNGLDRRSRRLPPRRAQRAGASGVLGPHHASPRRGDGKILELPGKDAYVFATSDGIFEPFHRNGHAVRAGEAAGRIHCTWDPARPPETLHYQSDGHRLRTPAARPRAAGNCCLVVATTYLGTPELITLTDVEKPQRRSDPGSGALPCSRFRDCRSRSRSRRGCREARMPAGHGIVQGDEVP